MRRLMASLACVGLTVMAAACGRPVDEPTVVPVVTSSASPTRSATEWTALVRAARIDAGDVGAAAFHDEDFDQNFELPCAVSVSATRRAGRAWSYVDGDAALAFCYTLTYLAGPAVGQSIVVCHALVSRGPLVALIGTYDLTREPSLARLATLVPVAANALVRALPESAAR